MFAGELCAMQEDRRPFGTVKLLGLYVVSPPLLMILVTPFSPPGIPSPTLPMEDFREWSSSKESLLYLGFLLYMDFLINFGDSVPLRPMTYLEAISLKALLSWLVSILCSRCRQV